MLSRIHRMNTLSAVRLNEREHVYSNSIFDQKPFRCQTTGGSALVINGQSLVYALKPAMEKELLDLACIF